MLSEGPESVSLTGGHIIATGGTGAAWEEAPRQRSQSLSVVFLLLFFLRTDIVRSIQFVSLNRSLCRSGFSALPNFPYARGARLWIVEDK